LESFINQLERVMKKQVTQHQKRELARRKAMPIALCISPLKHIAARDHTKILKDGKVVIEMGPAYRDARILANMGHGGAVRHIERNL
jgi:hypothetical protein